MRRPPKRTLSRAVLKERVPSYAVQVLVVAAVGWLVYRAVVNFGDNIRALGVSAGFGFLGTNAGFDIGQALLPFGPSSSYRDAIVVALLNTLLVIVLASVISTAIALLVAFGRLAQAGLVRAVSSLYVEVFRNIPLLLQILFWYALALSLLPNLSESLELGPILVSNRGIFLPRIDVDRGTLGTLMAALVALGIVMIATRRWLIVQPKPAVVMPAFALACLILVVAVLALVGPAVDITRPQVEGFDVTNAYAILPELLALTLGLSIYNSAFLAEIFRAGVLSVPRGQIEAATSVGLSGARAAVLVTLPQALRVALPAAGNQYQTLAKASSLAAAIGYPDIMQVLGGTIASQTGQALEAMALVVVLYGAINLAIAGAVALVNRRLLRLEGR